MFKPKFSNFRYTGIYVADTGYVIAFAKVDITRSLGFFKKAVEQGVDIFTMHFNSQEGYWRFCDTGKYVEPNSDLSNVCLAYRAKFNLHTVSNVREYIKCNQESQIDVTDALRRIEAARQSGD